MCYKLFQVKNRWLWYCIFIMLLAVILTNCGEAKITYCEISYFNPDFSRDGKKIAFIMKTYTYEVIESSVGNQIDNEEWSFDLYVYDLETSDSEFICSLGTPCLKWKPKTYITLYNDYNKTISKIYPETNYVDTFTLKSNPKDICLPEDTDVIIYTDENTIYIENMAKSDIWIKEIDISDYNGRLIYLDSEKLLGMESLNGAIFTFEFDNKYDTYNFKRYNSSSYYLQDWYDSTHIVCGYNPYLYELRDTDIREIKLIDNGYVYDYNISYDKNQLVGIKPQNHIREGDIVLLEKINDTSSLKTILKYKKIKLDRYEYESIF